MPSQAPRLRHQRGYLYKKGNAWYVRYQATERVGGRIVRRQRAHRIAIASGEYKTKGAARQLADAFIAPLNEARGEATATLEQFVEQTYLPAIEAQKRISTFSGYVNLWKLYLKPHGAIALRDFDTATAEQVFAAVQAKHQLSITTLRHIKAFLSGAFRAARRLGVLAGENPIHDAELPKAKPPQETYAYSLQEIQQMLEILEELEAALVAVAAFTGLRKGEIAGLRWEDIGACDLKVTQAYWRGHLQEPKTTKSKAPVPVVAQLAERLQRLRDKRPLSAGLVFAALDGGPLDLDAIARDVIRPAFEKHGLAWHGWHAFRRGLATNLHHLGVQDKVIQRILRHSNVSVTQACYIKTSDSDVQAAMDKLAEVSG